MRPWRCSWIRQQLRAIHKFVYSSRTSCYSEFQSLEDEVIVARNSHNNRHDLPIESHESPRELVFYRYFSDVSVNWEIPKFASEYKRSAKFLQRDFPTSKVVDVNTCGLRNAGGHKTMFVVVFPFCVLHYSALYSKEK